MAWGDWATEHEQYFCSNWHTPARFANATLPRDVGMLERITVPEERPLLGRQVIPNSLIPKGLWTKTGEPWWPWHSMCNVTRFVCIES